MDWTARIGNEVLNSVLGHFVRRTQCSYYFFSARLLKFLRSCRLLSFFSFLFSLSPDFRSPILGGSLTLYISFQSILALYLLIMQVIIWVFVPSATFPNPLWVAATKTALFRGHFFINAVKTLVGCIQCRWQFLLELFLHHTPMGVLLYLSFF